MVTILQKLTNSKQTFDDMEHTSMSLNACFYYEISVSVLKDYKKKKQFDGRLPKLFSKRQNLDRTKMQEFADVKLYVAKMMISFFDILKKNVGK